MLNKEEKHPKQPKLVEVRYHKNIAEHDLVTKNKKVIQSLQHNHQVKIRLQLLGREKAHPKEAVAWLNNLIEAFTEYSVTNRIPTPDNLTVTLFPKKHQK